MYQHGFTDLDGHMWELVYMDNGPGGEGVREGSAKCLSHSH